MSKIYRKSANIATELNLYVLTCTLAAYLLTALPATAQPCYVRTSDHALGNFFVKAISDSTCFGQWYDSLYYQNIKTQEIYFKFKSKEIFNLPANARTTITDILLYDSLVIVSWENGYLYRILKVDSDGHVREVPTILDQMPWLQIDYHPGWNDSRKIRRVNDSIALMSCNLGVYTFIIANNKVRLIDSLHQNDPIVGGELFDSVDDTLVILRRIAKEVLFYTISKEGFIAFVRNESIDKQFTLAVHAYFGHGNIYLLDQELNVLIRPDSGFVFKEGPYYSLPLHTLMLQNTIAQIAMENYDRIDLYDRNLKLLCSKPEFTSRAVLSSSNLGDKIFLARSDGISTWIPDTSTTAIKIEPNISSQSGIDLWPSPSSTGSITVCCEDPFNRVLIRDVIGRIMYDNSQQATHSETISTIGFKSGVYFIELQTATGPRRRKIMVIQQ